MRTRRLSRAGKTLQIVHINQQVKRSHAVESWTAASQQTYLNLLLFKVKFMLAWSLKSALKMYLKISEATCWSPSALYIVRLGSWYSLLFANVWQLASLKLMKLWPFVDDRSWWSFPNISKWSKKTKKEMVWKQKHQPHSVCTFATDLFLFGCLSGTQRSQSPPPLEECRTQV